MPNLLGDDLIGEHTPIIIDNYVYHMKFLDISHFSQILALQEKIKQSLPDQTTYRIDPPTYVYKHFQRNHNVIGAFYQGELVGYHIISFPGLRNENFGTDLAFEEEQLLKSAHFETTAVHPLHRGNQLLKKMAVIHLRILDNKDYTHVLCTVSPANYFSLKNVLELGFVIRAIKEKYYGLRYILYKSLDQPIIVNTKSNIRIKNTDIDRQEIVLGQGYCGYAIEKGEDGLIMLYGQPHSAGHEIREFGYSK